MSLLSRDSAIAEIQQLAETNGITIQQAMHHRNRTVRNRTYKRGLSPEIKENKRRNLRLKWVEMCVLISEQREKKAVERVRVLEERKLRARSHPKNCACVDCVDKIKFRKSGTVKEICEQVAKKYEISLSGLKSKSRSNKLTIPRFEVFWRARNECYRSLPDIAHHTVGCHHTSVLHGILRYDQIREQIKAGEDPKLPKGYAELIILGDIQ